MLPWCFSNEVLPLPIIVGKLDTRIILHIYRYSNGNLLYSTWYKKKGSLVATEPGIACDADAGDRDAAWGAAAASKLAGRDDGEGRGGFGRRGHGPFAAAGGSGAICFTVRAPWHGTSVSRREDCRGK